MSLEKKINGNKGEGGCKREACISMIAIDLALPTRSLNAMFVNYYVHTT
jgi:hypothetical protein